MLFYNPIYSDLALPPRHRFPILKYAKLKDRLDQSSLNKHIFLANNKASDEQLKLCHDNTYIEAFCNGTMSPPDIKRMGFPWSPELVERTLLSVGASIQAAHTALEKGFAANLSGGYHHAYADKASGFCIFNDLAVAACDLIAKGKAETVLILDCDVHQGDGTAAILKSRADIITCSIHCEQNFPRLKEQSDYDFALPTNTQDTAYLDTLEQALSLCTRLHSPDIILYNAGADIFTQDELGNFAITLAGVRRREELILSHCYHHSIPLMCALGGGYQRNLTRLVDVHEQLFQALLHSGFVH
ncbi:histone deacetylase family protein [Pseudoalteromonas luteoviolacea]|uniref:histone deacetylase family protein n=1 Tax=Pseudoalteromonas luteoviolacea TaxID=43657 RepID=UPI00114E97A4|nr:histone deacetylase [Pseudoalteromonas luteoviolacea]TQF71719.1 histone deacetylase [Pseudoalteromonas luteoviolacea]